MDPSEKNSSKAFIRSFNLGFGTETDVRDRMGDLVISHDPPIGGEMLLADFLNLAKETMPLLALNIKADGLAKSLKMELDRVRYSNYFVFDMSGPEYLVFKKVGLRTFARVSEHEHMDVTIPVPSGIWLDAFTHDSWRLDWLRSNDALKLAIGLVSPELHGRNHLPFWEELRNADFHLNENIILCTDLPEAARDFFGRQND
jgi:hypothetical protein